MKIIEEGVTVWATETIHKSSGEGRQCVARYGDHGEVLEISEVIDDDQRAIKGKADIRVAFDNGIATVGIHQVTTEEVGAITRAMGPLEVEYEFESWLALFPDLLDGDAQEVIDDFLRETAMPLEKDLVDRLIKVFEEMKARRDEGE